MAGELNHEKASPLASPALQQVLRASGHAGIVVGELPREAPSTASLLIRGS